MSIPPLCPLHPDHSLIQLKLDQFSRFTTEERIASLEPGQDGALKARPDGIRVDGHHRIRVLRDRGIDVDALPREVIPRDKPLEDMTC